MDRSTPLTGGSHGSNFDPTESEGSKQLTVAPKKSGQRSSVRNPTHLPIASRANNGEAVDRAERSDAIELANIRPASRAVGETRSAGEEGRDLTSPVPLTVSTPELPPLGPTQMSLVPPELRTAYANLQETIKHCYANSHEPGLERRYADAFAHYVSQASQTVQRAISGSRQLTDPTVRTTLVNMLTQMLNNVQTFTLGTVVATVAQNHMKSANPYVSAAINSGWVAFMQAFLADTAPRVGRALGGTESELRFTIGDHANNGLYTKMIGQMGLSLFSVAIYGSSHLALTAKNPAFFNDSLAGNFARSLASGAAMSVGTQAALTAAAVGTRMRSDLTTMTSKSESGRNRSDKNGVYQFSYAPWYERQTAAMMIKRVMLRTLSSLVGSTFLFMIMGAANDKLSDDPVKHSAASVLGGFSVMFIAMQLVQMVGTLLALDPKRHIARFTKDANAVLINQLQDSSNKGTLALVTNFRCAIENGMMGAQARQELLNDASVLNGAAFREAVAAGHRTDDGEAEVPASIVALQTKLGNVADEISRQVGVVTVPGHPTALIDYTFLEIVRKLDIAWESIDSARKNYLERGNGVLEPDLKNALHRLRDILPSLMQCVTQMGGAEHLHYDPRIREVTESVLPLLAVVDKIDSTEDARNFGEKLGEISANLEMGKGSATQMLAQLSGLLQTRGMTDEIVALHRRTSRGQHDLDHVRTTLDRLLAGGKRGETLDTLPDLSKLLTSEDASRVLILMNKLQPAAGPEGAQALNGLIERFGRINGTAPKSEARDAVNAFVRAFRDGRFTLRQLKDQLLDRLDAAPDEVVSAAASSMFSKLVGKQFIDTASHEEVPADAGKDSIGDLRSRAAMISSDVLSALWTDMQHKPANRRKAMETVLSLPVPDTVYDVKMTEQNDGHFHSTGYNGAVNDMGRQLLHAAAARVRRTLTAAIPHQVPNSNARQKYYTAIERMMYYVNRDPSLAMQRLRLNREDVERAFSPGALELLRNFQPDIQVSATGSVPLDGNSMKRELDHLVRAFGVQGDDLYVDVPTVGELTLSKEQVGRLTAGNMGLKRRPQNAMDLMKLETWQDWVDRLRNKPDRIRVENESSIKLMMDACNAGRAVIIHADRGTPLNKRANDESLALFFERVALLQRTQMADPLRSMPGFENAPPRYFSATHAHGPATAKNVAETPDHCKHVVTQVQQINRDFGENGVVRIDVAWDYTAHYVAEGTMDMFVRNGVSPKLVKALHDMVDTYRSFVAVGSAADTADDMNIRDQASEGRNASDIVSALHYEALASMARLIRIELRDNFDTRQKIYQMMRANPADQADGEGNNWLGYFYTLRKSLVYGSDALQIGAKTHGAEAYAINQRMYEFIYALFDEMKQYYEDDEGLAEVTARLARQNFVDMVDDPRLAARRRAYDALVNEGSGSWSTGYAEPVGRPTTEPFPPLSGVRPEPPAGLRQRRAEKRRAP